MTITTTQVAPDEALRAVADGKQVQMVWTDDEGNMYFTSLNRSIRNITKINDCFLIVDTVDDSVDEKIAESQENIAENCENAAEEAPTTVVTDPDTTPITVAIPNSQMSKKMARWNLNDDEILRLKNDGLTERQIAERLDVTQPTIHNHIQKMKREKRL